MDNKKMQEKALERYGYIATLVSGNLDPGISKAQFFSEAASRAGVHPYTVERWYKKYMKEGFDGLFPKNRSDLNSFRKLEPDTQNEIDYILSQYPRLSSTMIYEKLLSNGTITRNDVSLSTVNRYVKITRTDKEIGPAKDMRRYECEHINEVWCGDSSVGPYLKLDGKKYRTYIIALIDDASRMIVGIDIFFNDNFVNLMSVIKSAVAKYGKPKKFNFDNGANYRSTQMTLLAARIGTVIHYNPARTPTGKAKIERWFRTMKDHWMHGLHMDEFGSLDELRESLYKFVQGYNQRPHSSLDGKTPADRFFTESHLIIRMSDIQIERSFLLEVERTVSNDNVVKIDNTEYEVNYRYQGQRLLLRYSPDLSKIFVVDRNTQELEPITLLDKHKNATAKRRKQKISEMGENT
ncbi:MAG: DDE-type integrase/transposase/recombinase [Anaerovoracaceae bacterium]